MTDNLRLPMPAAESAVRDTLVALGPRVRAWRARRSMTRRQLAEDSGLSERFLADVESGKGNASVVSLESIAGALGITLTELLQEAPRPELRRIQRLLGTLSDAQLEQVYRQLSASFGPHSGQERERRVALIGLRGAGKSTLGLQLAASYGLPFVELDREIERDAGTSMHEIIMLHGQEAYRSYEHRALLRLAEQQAGGLVLTTGGSIVSESQTFELLRQHFFCVWIKASAEEHMMRVVAQGDLRPFGGAVRNGAAPERSVMNQALQDIRRILATREALYARADAVVDTTGRSPLRSLRDLKAAIPGLRGMRAPAATLSKKLERSPQT